MASRRSSPTGCLPVTDTVKAEFPPTPCSDTLDQSPKESVVTPATRIPSIKNLVVHDAWEPTRHAVQKCDLCGAKSHGVALQRCKMCSLFVCKECCSNGKMEAEKGHAIDVDKEKWETPRRRLRLKFKNAGNPVASHSGMSRVSTRQRRRATLEHRSRATSSEPGAIAPGSKPPAPVSPSQEVAQTVLATGNHHILNGNVEPAIERTQGYDLGIYMQKPEANPHQHVQANPQPEQASLRELLVPQRKHTLPPISSYFNPPPQPPFAAGYCPLPMQASGHPMAGTYPQERYQAPGAPMAVFENQQALHRTVPGPELHPGFPPSLHRGDAFAASSNIADQGAYSAPQVPWHEEHHAQPSPPYQGPSDPYQTADSVSRLASLLEVAARATQGAYPALPPNTCLFIEVRNRWREMRRCVRSDQLAHAYDVALAAGYVAAARMGLDSCHEMHRWCCAE